MPPRKRKRTETKREREASAAGETKLPSAKKVKSKAKAMASPEEMPMEKDEIRHWLIKSEPETRIEKGVDVKFGFEDLIKEPNKTACWDGVRNYQARNFLRDRMKVGHKCFFYHSNCKVPGIAGIVTIVKDGYPDHTQFDRKDIHFDPKASPDAPRWYMVDVKYDRWLKQSISLPWLKKVHLKHKAHNGPLSKLALFTQSRLSVSPVRQEEWDFILGMEKLEEDSS